MNFSKYSLKYKTLIDENLKLILDQKIENADDAFLKKYYSELSDYILAGGKRIRPMLTVASYNAFSKGFDEKILKPCVGLEFLHNASLVHDDIIDKDDLRRGEPSFHSRFRKYHTNEYNSSQRESTEFGNAIGIIGGDTTFFLGLEAYFNNQFNTKTNLSTIKIYEEAFLNVADGVLIEMDFVERDNIEISEYIKMISLKTSALIEKALLIGCTYAEVDEKYKMMFSSYGINLGRAFQIIDDILGTFGDEKKTGKPTDGDIREGKKTCLLIMAQNNLPKDYRKELNELIERVEMNENDVSRVKELFRKADVEQSCKELALRYYEDALESLNKLKSTINDSEFEFFETLLNFVVKREF